MPCHICKTPDECISCVRSLCFPCIDFNCGASPNVHTPSEIHRDRLYEQINMVDFCNSILSNAHTVPAVRLCVCVCMCLWMQNDPLANTSSNGNCMSKAKQPKKKQTAKPFKWRCPLFKVFKAEKPEIAQHADSYNGGFRFSFISTNYHCRRRRRSYAFMPYFIICSLSFQTQTAINSNAINYVATISMFRFIKFDTWLCMQNE